MPTGADDPECGRGSFRREMRVDFGGKLTLAHARPDRGESLLHGAVGNRGVHLQPGELAGILAHAQRPDRVGGEGVFHARQSAKQQQRVVGAHRLVERHLGHADRVDVGKRCRQSGLRPVCIVPVVEGDVGLFARAFGVQRRHQECLLLAPRSTAGTASRPGADGNRAASPYASPGRWRRGPSRSPACGSATRQDVSGCRRPSASSCRVLWKASRSGGEAEERISP